VLNEGEVGESAFAELADKGQFLVRGGLLSDGQARSDCQREQDHGEDALHGCGPREEKKQVLEEVRRVQRRETISKRS